MERQKESTIWCNSNEYNTNKVEIILAVFQSNINAYVHSGFFNEQ